jgi:hypothetical protein
MINENFNNLYNNQTNPYYNNQINPYYNNQINPYYNNQLFPYHNPYYNFPLFRYLENRDRRVLYDPLVAPERRPPINQYPYPLVYKNLINYPTRGYPENYQELGLAIRKEDEKYLQLFGRPTFPGSNQWEYYVRAEKDGYVNKIPINTRNKKELYDGDTIDVIGMNQEKGKFIIKLFDYNTPRYNPYDI